jgi:hypothetical protein
MEVPATITQAAYVLTTEGRKMKQLLLSVALFVPGMVQAASGIVSVASTDMIVASACTVGSDAPSGLPSEESAAIMFSEQHAQEFYDEHRESLFVAPTRVRIKAVLAPTNETAEEARRRATAGESAWGR